MLAAGRDLRLAPGWSFCDAGSARRSARAPPACPPPP